MSRRRKRARVPGTRSGTIVVLEHVYGAPRVGDAAANGRTILRASCGHAVYVSARGLDAIARRDKQLMCGPCLAAVAAEQGARLAVYAIDGGVDEPEAA